MTNEIGLYNANFLQLSSDIRTSATTTFNAQEAYDNTFEDVLLEQVSKVQEEEQKDSKVKFYNLGAPAGFFLDTSLLSEEDKIEISSSFCCF